MLTYSEFPKTVCFSSLVWEIQALVAKVHTGRDGGSLWFEWTAIGRLESAFEAEHHFKTYPHERDPSFSATAMIYWRCFTWNIPLSTPHILRRQRDFCTNISGNLPIFRFKINGTCLLYTHGCWAQAIARLHHPCQDKQLLSLQELFKDKLSVLLSDMTTSVLRQQNQTGSWGARNSKEETAYAVLMLTYTVQCDLDGSSY